MKEAFLNKAEGFATYDQQILLYSDLELSDYVNSPGKTTATSTSQARTIVDDKEVVMNQLKTELANADTNVINTAYYATRTQDLNSLSSDIYNNNKSVINTLNTNRGLTSRQIEINERAGSAKLEVLYFMQIIFISLCLIGVFAYLLSISYISSSLFWTLLTIVFALDLLIIFFKSRYSMFNRDSRYWNKMRFAYQHISE